MEARPLAYSSTARLHKQKQMTFLSGPSMTFQPLQAMTWRKFSPSHDLCPTLCLYPLPSSSFSGCLMLNRVTDWKSIYSFSAFFTNSVRFNFSCLFFVLGFKVQFLTLCLRRPRNLGGSVHRKGDNLTSTPNTLTSTPSEQHATHQWSTSNF